MFKHSFHHAIKGVALLIITTTTHAKFPENDYACHVSTKSGDDGIVLIQANNIDEAEAAAINSKARTIYNKRDVTVQVNECISTPGGRFKDREIQKFYENMPM